MGLLGEMPPEQELEFPVVLPNGSTAFCKVDSLGRVDPRQAYAPWLKPQVRRTARED